jgi:hypothetical protein
MLHIYKQVIQNTIPLYETECISNSVQYRPDVFLNTLTNIQKNLCKNFSFFIENNIFLDEYTKKIITKIYIKSIACHNAFNNLIIRYKRRRMKACNTSDLSCVPLIECKSTDLFELIDGNNKYIFKHSDMYNIIQSSITHADEFMMATPLHIKNPYTGIKFTKMTLYKLFMIMKRVPLLFMYYMKCDFNPETFLVQYEGILRTYIIQKTIIEYSPANLRIIIRDMLAKTTLYNICTGMKEPIVLAKDIKDDLTTLKPLVHHYYHSLFSLNPYQRHIEHKQLVRALIKLRKKPLSLLMYLLD